MAEEAGKAAFNKKEKAGRTGGFDKGLLLGEPEKVWIETDTGSLIEIGDQSGAVPDQAVDAGSGAQSNRAEEV
jgi:hypothetical protein